MLSCLVELTDFTTKGDFLRVLSNHEENRHVSHWFHVTSYRETAAEAKHTLLA